MSDLILTEDDFRIDIPAQPTTGVVYYDPRSGALKGAGLCLSPEVEFPHVVVPAETAERFMRGLTDMAEWLVFYNGSEPRLVCGAAEPIVVTPTGLGYTVVNRESHSAPVRMVAVVPKNDTTGVFLVQMAQGFTGKPGFTEPFDIIITKRGSPDEVAGKFSIDPVELFREGEVRLTFERPVAYDVDLITRPLQPVTYSAQAFDEACRPIPLPQGSFVDLRPFTRLKNRECDAGLVVDIADDHLLVHALNGGGLRYDRPTAFLMLAVTHAGRPDALLVSARLEIARLLRGEKIRVDLAEPLPEDIEVVSQLYFQRSYWRRIG